MGSRMLSTCFDLKGFLSIGGGARVVDGLCRACWPGLCFSGAHPVLPTRATRWATLT